MHQYLRSIGYSKLNKEKDIDKLLKGFEKHGMSTARRYIDSNDQMWLDIRVPVSERLGLCITGYIGARGAFHRVAYYPYLWSTNPTSKARPSVFRRVDGELYSAIIDDSRVGMTLIYQMDNPFDYLHKFGEGNPITGTAVSTLTGFCTKGFVLLPSAKGNESRARRAGDGGSAVGAGANAGNGPSAGSGSGNGVSSAINDARAAFEAALRASLGAAFGAGGPGAGADGKSGKDTEKKNGSNSASDSDSENCIDFGTEPGNNPDTASDANSRPGLGGASVPYSVTDADGASGSSSAAGSDGASVPYSVTGSDVTSVPDSLAGFDGADISDCAPTNYNNSDQEARMSLLEAARNGQTDAIEQLALEEMNTIATLSKRLQNEDIYSIVSSVFMPQGVECEIYLVVGEILKVDKIKNTSTNEEIYDLTLNANDMIIHVAINEADLEGEPTVGRRFKGRIWLQGRIEFR